KTAYFLSEKELTTAVGYGFPYGGDDFRQFVGADMRMGFVQNVFLGAKLHEYIQYAVHIAAFGATGVQFTIAVGAGATFAKAVIAFGIDNAFFVEHGQIAAARAHVFTSFEQYGL